MPDVIINGPEGRIEGRYHHVRVGPEPMALVLHPHPLHGGTMNNKVVYTLYQCFVKRGFSTPADQFSRRGAQPRQLRSRRRRTVRRSRRRSIGAADLQPQRRVVLGRRVFVRRLDRHATPDAAPGDRGVHLGGAAGEPIRFHLSRAVPLVGAGVAGRQGHAGADRARCRSWYTSWRINATSRSISAKSPGADHFFADQLELISSYVDTYIGDHTRAAGEPAPAAQGRGR